ncbi:hypothetical protein TGAM01_v209072 [Trichoderma gamsii]|uniref:Uncharacterized protein n=1 Tax=Trichoderma gamsii TaxID=398673 RepID=A0A2P4ZCI1_9HYPO|nr:hypothetical protein TGAM01_v209072 [Trichoderma gamsii]PON22002.1 hypothetical protein TGAM01_v209072 [Trichoderma gamsii]
MGWRQNGKTKKLGRGQPAAELTSGAYKQAFQVQTRNVLGAPYPCLNVLKLWYSMPVPLCISCLAHSLPCLRSPSPLQPICHVPLSSLRVLESDPACKKAQGLPRGPSGRGPGRAVVGVWAAPIKVAGPKPGFAGFALARPGATSNKRHWLVENGSLGRRDRLKPAWSPCCFCWAAAGRKLQHQFAATQSGYLSTCESLRLLLSA